MKLRHKRICDPIAILTIGHCQIEHARFRFEVLQRYAFVFVTHERDCVFGNLSRERHHVFAADEAIETIDRRDPLFNETEIVFRGEYPARRLLDALLSYAPTLHRLQHTTK